MVIFNNIIMNFIETVTECCKVDNYCAYKFDILQEENSDYNMKQLTNFIKIYNFVPTYDKWCLTCNKHDATKRCSKCKSVYFCSEDCQKKAWRIHKKHCGRDLFVLCATCSIELENLGSDVKCCDLCPVKFCSKNCMDKIIAAHKEFDCKYFQKTFN